MGYAEREIKLYWTAKRFDKNPPNTSIKGGGGSQPPPPRLTYGLTHKNKNHFNILSAFYICLLHCLSIIFFCVLLTCHFTSLISTDVDYICVRKCNKK